MLTGNGSIPNDIEWECRWFMVLIAGREGCGGGRYDFDFVVTFYWQPAAAAFDSKPKRER